jgi:hypothetical protein
MAHHKRRKPRRQVRCTICTDGRGGNAAPGKVFGSGPMGRLLKRLARRGENGKRGWKADQGL